MVIKMLIELWRGMDEPNENTNKDIENIFKKYQTEDTELNNTIAELKNTPEGLKSILEA